MRRLNGGWLAQVVDAGGLHEVESLTECLYCSWNNLDSEHAASVHGTGVTAIKTATEQGTEFQPL